MNWGTIYIVVNKRFFSCWAKSNDTWHSQFGLQDVEVTSKLKMLIVELSI